MADRIDPLETMPVSPHARLTRRVLWLLAGARLGFLYLPIVLLDPVLVQRAAHAGPAHHRADPRLVRGGAHQPAAPRRGQELDRRGRCSWPCWPRSSGPWPPSRSCAAASAIRAAARIVATLPIMLPGMLLGIGILIFLRRVLDLQLSLLTVVAGHLVFTVPFVILIVAARLQGFDRNLEWAAADLGADPRRTVRHVILPLIWPAILAGALISVTLSIDEFVVTFFTVGPQLTLPHLHLHPDQVRGHPRGQRHRHADARRDAGHPARWGRACVALRRRLASEGREVALMLAAVFAGEGRLCLEDRPLPGVKARRRRPRRGRGLRHLRHGPPDPRTCRPATRRRPARSWATSSSAASRRSGERGRGRRRRDARRSSIPTPSAACCDPCRAGRPASCLNVVALGIFRDGALASHVVAPAGAALSHLGRRARADRRPRRAARLRRERHAQGAPRARARVVLIFGAGAIGCLFLAVFRASRLRAHRRRRAQRRHAPTVARAMGADDGGRRPTSSRDALAERPAGRRGHRRRRGRQPARHRHRRRRPWRADRRLRDERERAPADPPGRDHGEVAGDLRLLHLELHVPRGDPTARERPAASSSR